MNNPDITMEIERLKEELRTAHVERDEALGDNGKRMQDELVEYCRELKRDEDRLNFLNNLGWKYGFESEHEGTDWCIGGAYRDVRLAIDAREAAEIARDNAAQIAEDKKEESAERMKGVNGE